MVIETESVDLPTPSGPMRTYLYRPVAPGGYPGVLFFSEIFQRTGPVGRFASMLAGHGFVVAVPEIFHELEPAGAELAYDQAGADRGNRDKVSKPVAAYDADARAVITCLEQLPGCTGRLGAAGICIGGHLAFRSAMNPEIRAAACLYPTDIHGGTLGLGGDDSLARAADIRGELLMIWGRHDPHIPQEGRDRIARRLNEAGLRFTWHEFGGAHAFMRDEGPRYDPELALICYGLILGLLGRRLGEGDQAS